jgi:hypothetical protein
MVNGRNTGKPGNRGKLSRSGGLEAAKGRYLAKASMALMLIPGVLGYEVPGARAGDLDNITKVLPQIAVGDAYTSTMRFVNSGDDDSGKILFYGNDGKPMQVDLGDGPVTEYDYSVKKGGNFQLSTKDIGATRSGYVLVKSDKGTESNLGASLEYMTKFAANRQIISVGSQNAASAWAGTAVIDPDKGEQSCYAFLNLGTDDATINIDLYDDGGRLEYQTSLTLKQDEHVAMYLGQMLSIEKFRGNLRASAAYADGSKAMIAPLGLLQKGDLFQAIPMIEVKK